MTDKDDFLVKQFLKESKQDIPDNGFSERVLASLPDEKTFVLSRRWTLLCWCLCIAILSFLYITGNLHINLRIPQEWLRSVSELQSPAFLGKIIMNGLQYALLAWCALLSIVFAYIYKLCRTL